ncbi:hypothetical protein D3C83_211120 [compost metagenome]
MLQIEFHDAKDAVKEIAKIRGMYGPSGREDDPIFMQIKGINFDAPNDDED